jgi:hypothetical protein
MCPQSTELLSRAIMVDINWQFSAADCDAIARGINKVLAAL